MSGRELVQVLAVVVLALAGCQTKTKMVDGRAAPPEPRPMPSMPDDARATQITATVSIKTHDSNGNGFPDTIGVQTFLLSPDHPGPIFERGDFVFALYPHGRSTRTGAALAEWRIDASTAEQRRFGSLFGPGYAFRLSLLEAGGDQYPLMSTNLVCRFEPADGRPALETPEPIGIQIGKRLARGGTTLGP